MAQDVGTGATLTFSANTGWDSSAVDIQTISWSGISREAIETTHLGTTTARTFMPGDLYDPGEVTMELSYDDGVDTPILLADTAETITLTFPTSGATFACSGFCTSFEVNVPLEERMTATLTWKMTGAITGL